MNEAAHIKYDDNSKMVQSLSDHLKNTANISMRIASEFGMPYTAYLTGILHDLGKYTHKFQAYINGNLKNSRGSIIHTFQGCKYVLDNFHASQNPYKNFAAELIAVVIGSHHGLFDCVDISKNIGLEYRKYKKDIEYEESVKALYTDGFDYKELKSIFDKAAAEVEDYVKSIDSYFQKEDEFCFTLGLLQRLLLSSLIEGDRRDTTEFMSGTKFKNWPEDMTIIWKSRLEYLESRINKLDSNIEINKARRLISEQCKMFSQNPCGIYSLNVPTGGGKTLSSLRYALAHAAKYGKRRIIFTSPLLSILEQNAQVIRDYINDDNLILEHHSNVVLEELNENELDERELQVQTWDSPIILTTMVQLLNTFFDGKTSSVRRFHSLQNSIIVIDEVQTIPVKMLTLFNLTIQYLSKFCKTTFILCSATQPSFDKAFHPLPEIPMNMVTIDNNIWQIFKRTNITVNENMRFEDVPVFIRRVMDGCSSLLVVCNKKSEAIKLAEIFKDSDWNIFHLSASMCVQHRRDTIEKIKKSLCDGKRTFCISTQVIEAGVDISFQKVIRFTAGLDSIIQAAGRCNRNGEYPEPQSVYAVCIADENLGMLPEISRGKTAMISLINAYENEPEAFDNDISSQKAIRYYYKKHYATMNCDEQDMYVKSIGTTMFDMLSTNVHFYDENIPNIDDYQFHQAFKTAGHAFTVFENDTMEVLVPYKEGREIIKCLCSDKALKDYSYRDMLLKKARSYTVSIFNNQRQKYEESGSIYPVCNGYTMALSEGNYDEMTGLIPGSNDLKFMEV